MTFVSVLYLIIFELFSLKSLGWSSIKKDCESAVSFITWFWLYGQHFQTEIKNYRAVTFTDSGYIFQPHMFLKKILNIQDFQ